ncbi:PLDc N-terminal domain-containing protein [Acholeplasma hippikon]|uniref:Cardiolipin synthase N-terminal domain-containing protein n=1 Tax=Acholeplasma hippikon TaxID=264636 RepID=A0A449BJQ8_9MOLU|nr:PLDc N-terminal domain-containing protein [Acholeplasma hippikon]VEU82701.1 Uncharacterised protein [Acholeplasma hippikon]
MDLKELIPFLIPLVIVQFLLLFYTLRHIVTHDKYKRGTRNFWIVITILLMNFVGPILYFIFGKEN